MHISIHAPAWGATKLGEVANATEQFQSTLPRGERRQSIPHHAVRDYFNPRSRVGSDGGQAQPPCRTHVISIHAPAWGATLTNAVLVLKFWRFQSTLPRGERLADSQVRCWEQSQFQSTLPRGERPQPLSCLYPFPYFNPRSRVGSDAGTGLSKCCRTCYFNPRSRVGSDPLDSQSHRPCSYFNPRSRVGATEYYKGTYTGALNFNPRSRVGSDFLIVSLYQVFSYFNPRSRVGSDLCWETLYHL